MNHEIKEVCIPQADTRRTGSLKEPIDSGAFQLTELVDATQLNNLMDNFCNAVGIAAAIIDLNGKVLIASRWQRICTDFHRINQTTCARCIESDTELALHLNAGESFSVYSCLNGMTDAASPIIIEGKHLANVFVGQFLLSPPDREFFRRQAETMGFDRETYLQALDEVPIISKEKLPAILGFLSGFAKLVASYGLQRLRAERIADELSRQHKMLEHLVNERTRELNASNVRLRKEIVEHEQADATVRRLNAELEQRVAQRTAELETAIYDLENFNYSASHDLRIPLRAIDGFSKILLTEHASGLDDEGRRLLNIVRESTGRMTQYIDDMLSFSRTGRTALAPEEIKMEELMREVIEELKPAENTIQLELNRLPNFVGDRAMMRQALICVLTNAIKFSRTRDIPKIQVGASVNRDEIIYYVQDNGVGFDMRYVGKLFGVFQRLHAVAEFEGNGIGLAVFKRIITRHGGRVWAEGKVNEGATIYFALPIKEKNLG
ncbi:MAG: PocR ligand-binding domain-containing protein [Gallionellaceae bacterium]|jgi:signal transduction histidine kinase